MIIAVISVMLILGLHSKTHDIGAALLRDGRLLGVVEEERLSGHKHQPGIEVDGSTPRASINALLGHVGARLEDIDVIAHAGQPGAHWIKMDTIHQRYRELAKSLDPTLERTRFFEHHQCHAASAFYSSGFADAAVLTIDGAGCDHLSTTVWRADQQGMELLDEYPSSQSLGFMYSNAAEAAGLGPYGIGEGKLMALAALGEERPEWSELITWRHERYRIDPESRERFQRGSCEAPRLPGSAHFAASVQAQLSRTVYRLVEQTLARISTPRLCLAGGVALNCRMNGALLEIPALAQLYVPPMPGDSGLCVGAAYLAAEAAGQRVSRLQTPFLGLPVPEAELATLAAEGATRTDDPHGRAAESIARGQIVAWMRGRAEFGPRALGHRSILGDPRSREHVDRLNRIKGREPWRPVAPAIADHAIERYCTDTRVNRTMGIAVPMTEAAHAEIPGGLHVDGSARVQRVTPEDEHMHRLVTQFNQHTGIPCLLNTSLNGPGLPLCHHIDDALRLFRTTEIDVLIVEDRVLSKEG